MAMAWRCAFVECGALFGRMQSIRRRASPWLAADRVFLNGAIYTVDAERSWAEAVAIRDGRIVYVGDNAGAARYIGDATRSPISGSR